MPRKLIKKLIPHIGFLRYLDSAEILLQGSWLENKGLIMQAAVQRFCKICFLTNQKCSRDNFSKVITFFASQFVFIAFGSFLLIWPLSIKQLVIKVLKQL